jgi:O-antigen/teichoic acid export membrane protein
MRSVRRAFVYASGGRYVVMAANLCMAIVMARLLSPAEYGLYALGSAVFAIAEAIRELGSGSYLVQQHDLTLRKIQSTFTVNLLTTVAVSAALFLSARIISEYYAAADLERYLHTLLLFYAMGPFLYPSLALLSREMQFGKIAVIGMVTTLVNTIVAIGLAFLGFSYMSFAWAAVVSGLVGIGLVFWARPDLSIFRFSLSEWRDVLKFGTYDSAISLLIRLWDYMPYLILGRMLNAEIVGLWQRAMWLCLFPERVILAGVGAVALPAFSEQSRQGTDLRENYLRAIELITAVQWPALLLVILLAHPLVLIVLGQQWLGTVPFIQILGVALMCTFPTGLNYPTLVAKGAIRTKLLLVLTQGLISTAVFFAAAQYGAHAAAMGLLISIPVNALLSLLVLRAKIGFSWLDLTKAISRSAATTILCAVVAISVLGTIHANDVSLSTASAVVAGTAVAWLLGLLLTRHPLWEEVRRALAWVVAAKP